MRRFFSYVVLLLVAALYVNAGTIARGTKTATGTTAFGSNSVLSSTELNTDFDVIVNEFNGNIDNANIKTAAGIVPTKLDDASADATAQDTETSPGSYASRSLATTMSEEIARLRYGIANAAGVQPCVRVNGSGAQTVTWIELPVGTPNLVANSHFATDSNSDGIPDGFAAEGAGGGGLVTNASTAEGFGYIWTVTGGDNEGVSYTLDKLRASTRYAIVVRAALSSGAGDITTTGANAASEWRNLDTNLSGATQADYCGVIQTDATPTNVVVKIMGDGGSFLAGIREFGVYELGAVKRASHSTYAVATDTDSHSFTAGAGETATDASITINVPDSGYVVKVTADGSCLPSAGGNSGLQVELQEDTVIMGSEILMGNGSGASVTNGALSPFSVTRVSVNPSAGSHIYRIVGDASGQNWSCSNMYLIVERERLE